MGRAVPLVRQLDNEAIAELSGGETGKGYAGTPGKGPGKIEGPREVERRRSCSDRGDDYGKVESEREERGEGGDSRIGGGETEERCFPD